MPMTFATATHTGLVRRSNEDAFYARPPVFVIADGMGGAQAGEVASAMATKAFEYFLPQSSRPEEELKSLISRVNASIFEYASGDLHRTGMGTTITAAAVSGSTVSIAHVGDSRAWLLREGKLIRLTEDHSLVAELIKEGQLTEAEAAVHPQRSVITRALGVEAEVDVDTYSIPWQAGDVFLLASDGLHGMIEESEIAALTSQKNDLREMAQGLIEAANSRGGHDNVTVVLFCPDGSVAGIETGEHSSWALAASPASKEDPVVPEAEAGDGSRPLLKRIRSWAATIPGTILIGALVLAAVLGGLYFGTRFIYFVGTEGDQVAIYRGVPYELGPFPLFSLYRSSPVKFKNLEPFQQERINAQNLQTRGGAQQMLDNLLEADKQKKENATQAKDRSGQSTTPGTSTLPQTSTQRVR